MMNRLVLILAGLVLLAGCAAKGGDNAAADTQKVTAQQVKNMDFLHRMGVNTDQLMLIGDKLNLSWNEEFCSLTDDQVRALLNDVYKLGADEDVEGVHSIIGVKPLAGDHTMVLFHIEFGDGSKQVMGIYDQQGRMTDYLETGSSLESMVEASDDMSKGVSRRNDVDYEFPESEIILNRFFKQYEWVLNGEQVKPVRDMWTIKKVYRYSIGEDGKLKWLKTDISKSGQVDEDVLLRDEVNDLQMRPASDPKVMDDLNAFVSRDAVQADIKAEGDLEWGVSSALWGVFMENPQGVLTWMAKNQGKGNYLLPLFEGLFSSGTINKNLLVKELEKMTDAKARQYLDTLTAQWGPSNSEG